MNFNQIKTGKNITLISNETINAICRIKAFDCKEMNDILYKLHKNLLEYAMNKNKSWEVGVFLNLNNTDEMYIVKGVMNGIDMRVEPRVINLIKYNPLCSVAVLHNHPRNGLFSGKDVSTFCDYNSIYLMTAVCNDGTIYMMRKEKNFNPLLLKEYYNQGLKQNLEKKKAESRKRSYVTPYYNGIKNVAKHAKEIGITYRCSVKRK